MSSENLLKSKGFIPLFITILSCSFNDVALRNGIVIWLTYNTYYNSYYDSHTLAALAFVSFTIPFIILSATAGEFADKYVKVILLRIVKTIELILMLIAAFFFYMESLRGLMLIMFLTGLQSTFFGPLKYSILKELLPDKKLLSGNAFINSGVCLVSTIGTVIGCISARTQLYGPAPLLVILTTIAFIGMLTSYYIPKTKQLNPYAIIEYNFINETVKTIHYALYNKVISFIIMSISWFWIIATAFLVQTPTYVKDILHGNELLSTTLFIVFAIGMASGSLLCVVLLKGTIHNKYNLITTTLISLLVLIFVGSSVLYGHDVEQYFLKTYGSDNITNILQYVTENTILLNPMEFLFISVHSLIIILSLFCVSLFGGMYIVPLYTLLQYCSPKKHIARIIAASNIISAIISLLPSIITIMFIALGFNVLHVFFFIGIFNIPAILYVSRIVAKRHKYV